MGSVALEGFGSGGGAALNFKVVGNPQPESAQENTIWVNTDVPIGAWYFIATQPENLNEGDVWFPTGTASPVEFNALKKNGIQVYPQSAKQMVSGSLADVEAKSYQGGAWVDWIDYLFNNGNTFDSITGGWERKSYINDRGGSFSISDRLVVDSPDINHTVCVGLVDFDPSLLSNYTEMIAVLEYTTNGAEPRGRIGIVPNYELGTSGIESKWTAYSQFTSNGAHTLTLDISDINTGYPMVSSYNGKTEALSIWLK